MDERAGPGHDRRRRGQARPEPPETRLAARTRELDLIQMMGRRAAEARSPAELFAAAVEVLQRGEELDAALVAYRIDGAPEMQLHLARPLDLSCAAELAGRAAAVLSWDIEALPMPRELQLDGYDPAMGMRRSFREEDLVALPVLRRDRPVACLLVLPSRHVEEAELRLLYATSNQLSLHLERILSDREAEADRFRSILDSMPQAVLLADNELRLRQVNPAASRLLERFALDVAGSLRPVVDRLGLEGPVNQVLSGGSSCADVEVSAGERVLTVTVTPLAAAKHGTGGLVLVLTDVTERRRMQRQLSQSEKMSSLGQMISGVAHELNNPLASILGYAQLLGAGQADEKLAKRVGILQEEAGRCRKIVQNLLSFARQHEPERKRLSLNEVVRSVLALMGYQLRVNGVTVETGLDPDLPAMNGDAHQLQQVLVNLLTNARQAIRSAADSGTIHLTTSVGDDGDVVLEVEDSGPGIPDTIRRRIFDPFFTTKSEGEGTGLGLSLVYGIVTAHGGTLDVAEGGGRGARFMIRFPLDVELPATGEIEAPLADDLRVPAAAILVVEDEPSLAAMIREVLEQDGHRVVVADDGAQALERVIGEPFDLVVSDVKMPGMGGEALYRELQRRGSEMAGRLLLTSGDTVGADTETFVRQHGLPLLRKPFDVIQLRRAVHDRIGSGGGE